MAIADRAASVQTVSDPAPNTAPAAVIDPGALAGRKRPRPAVSSTGQRNTCLIGEH